MNTSGWHRADIIAAVHKRKNTLAGLARDHGLGDATLRAALSYPRKPSNTIIANFLGVSLHELWPTWFDVAGRLIINDRNRPSRNSSSQKFRRKLNKSRRRA